MALPVMLSGRRAHSSTVRYVGFRWPLVHVTCRSLEEYNRLTATLAQSGWIGEGYVQDRGPGAGGPCYQWTRKVKGKTVSVALSKEQYEWLNAAITNWHPVQVTLRQMQRLSRRVLFTTVPDIERRKTAQQENYGTIPSAIHHGLRARHQHARPTGIPPTGHRCVARRPALRRGSARFRPARPRQSPAEQIPPAAAARKPAGFPTRFTIHHRPPPFTSARPRIAIRSVTKKRIDGQAPPTPPIAFPSPPPHMKSTLSLFRRAMTLALFTAGLAGQEVTPALNDTDPGLRSIFADRGAPDSREQDLRSAPD